jgi:DNA-directed RNA polymerase specialized sigma24 family protein
MPHLPGRPPSDADYTEFVHASWASLYRTAYLLLGDHAEAEDLTQTALAKTYAAWHRVRDLNAAPGYARTSWRSNWVCPISGVSVETPAHPDASLFPVCGHALENELHPRGLRGIESGFLVDALAVRRGAEIDAVSVDRPGPLDHVTNEQGPVPPAAVFWQRDDVGEPH